MSSASASMSATTSSGTGSASSADKYRLPTSVTLNHVTKLSIVEDKPVMFDYWTDSLDRKVLIGVRDNGEKLLVKSEDEYTSPIAKIWKVETEFIIMTENSLYVVSADIPKKRIA